LLSTVIYVSIASFLSLLFTRSPADEHAARDKMRWFQSKIANFSTPYFLAIAEEFPLKLGTNRRLRLKKNNSDGATWARKKLDDILSRLGTVHERDVQTGRHRATAKTALTHSVAR